MFFRILKKDLKRKRTMNIILLLFVILASMFTASSVNNIIAVTKGLDFYAEQSGISDYLVMTVTDEEGVIKVLEDKDYVSRLRTEHCFLMPGWSDVQYKGAKLKEMPETPFCMADSESKLSYFDQDNNTIRDVESGYFYGNIHFCEDTDLKPGEKVTFRVGDEELELEYKGLSKDIVFGSQLTMNSRVIMDKDDIEKLFGGTTDQCWNITYIDTTDTDAVADSVSNIDGVMFQGSKELLKMAFSVNIIVAYILLAASVGLVLISLVILRFTIQFTITDEFREIGVMKAVGVDNTGIRKLYLTKYLGLSVIGSALGFLLSVPFGKMVLRTVSELMYLGNIHSTLAGAVCSAAIVAVILLFCYRCTRSIKKLSPIDAVRNGQTGERFGRRSVMSLGRSRLPATGFLAVNDIFSSPKQFGMITAIFTVCLLLVTVVSNLSSTLNSDILLRFIGEVPADAYYTSFDSEEAQNVNKVENGGEIFADHVSEILAENGMPAECSFTYTANLAVRVGDTSEPVRFSLNRRADMEDYTYDEGYAPESADEIALTPKILDKLGISLGDKVMVVTGEGERECMVTASFASMNNTGSFGMLHSTFDLSPADLAGGMGVSVRFDGDPDEEQVKANILKMREIFDTEQVLSSDELVTEALGVGDALSSVKYLLTAIMIVVTALLTVLIERSFISKEKNEIALMKAIGAANGEIIAQHTLRFAVVSAVVCIAASAATVPLSNLLISPILSMVTEVHGVKCAVNILDVFVVSPAIMMAITTAGAFLTALYTRKITSSDTSGNE